MANIRLWLNNVELDLTDDDYSFSYKNVDSLKTSEAGTNLRDITRTGIPSMKISYECIESEKVKLLAYSKLSSLTAKYWDETTQAYKTWDCFMTGYSEKLIVEGTTHRYYKVGFTLEDLED